jgi:hypothetical protein
MTKRLGFVLAILMMLLWSPLRTWAVRPPIERSVGPEQGGGHLSTGDDDEPGVTQPIPETCARSSQPVVTDKRVDAGFPSPVDEQAGFMTRVRDVISRVMDAIGMRPGGKQVW